MSQHKVIPVQCKNGVPTSEGMQYLRGTHRAVFETDGLVVHHSAAPPGDMGGYTINSNFQMTITLIDLGHLDYTTDGETLRQSQTRPGDLFLWLGGRPIYGCWEKPLECLSLVWESAFLTNCARESIDPDRVEMVNHSQFRDPLVESIGMTLWQKAQTDGVDKIYGEALACAFAVHTLKHYSTLKPVIADLSRRGLGASVLRQVLDYIGDNLTDDIALNDLAEEAGLSVYHFARLFKRSTGQTPYQYVIAQRVERAKTLLGRGGLTIGEVAQAVGFYDHAHFIRHYKKLTGTTPGRFPR